jgi:hypothetical protein
VAQRRQPACEVGHVAEQSTHRRAQNLQYPQWFIDHDALSAFGSSLQRRVKEC